MAGLFQGAVVYCRDPESAAVVVGLRVSRLLQSHMGEEREFEDAHTRW